VKLFLAGDPSLFMAGRVIMVGKQRIPLTPLNQRNPIPFGGCIAEGWTRMQWALLFGVCWTMRSRAVVCLGGRRPYIRGPTPVIFGVWRMTACCYRGGGRPQCDGLHSQAVACLGGVGVFLGG
jgi:hypothetical protein